MNIKSESVTMKDYTIQTEEKKGNQMMSMRFRIQSFSIPDDMPMESEWVQFKHDAVRLAKRWLIRDFKKFGKDDFVVKIFNELNYKQEPLVITLEMAQQTI